MRSRLHSLILSLIFRKVWNPRLRRAEPIFRAVRSKDFRLARALAKKADLFVFDDSFSALDFKTDAALRHALADETKDAAVLIIAQRVSTIRHADQILVLDEGRLAGLGTHEALMNSCEIYRDIANSQMKGSEQYAGK